MNRPAALLGAALLTQLWVALPAFACAGACQCGKAMKTTAKAAGKTAANALLEAQPHLEPMAATCSCQSASDCTCKKGQCKCKKCGAGRARGKVIDSLQEAVRPAPLPNKAQRDASAGLFI
jgi:hypothetical protein